MKLGFIWGPAFAALALAAACAGMDEAPPRGDGLNDNLRINQIQAVGTHNSYKLQIPEPIMALIKARNADAAVTLDYWHRPIAEQLDAGARQVELDPLDDPDGGAFADPLGARMLAAQGIGVLVSDREVMAKPGIKVLHQSDIDYRTSCLTLVECLEQVKAWSDGHRDHTPILIMVNPKHTPISWPGASPVKLFGKDALNRLEAEILSVFARERIVTPDEVRGDHATLREGVLAGGWPTLGEARGRVLFVIDDAPARWKPYADGHPSLKGRVAFVNAHNAPDAPEAAILVSNEPVTDFELIKQRVAQGFIVRTRADADTREARTGDTARREKAFASGAQYVTTDYIWPDERFGTGFTVRLPGNAAARCNPVNGPESCR
jgi:Phosphoinositide phospholipase C, Ca2+-dependent